MTWHLKDRKLERQFLAIDSGFLEKLNEACEKLDTNKDGDFPEYTPFAIVLDNGMKLFSFGSYVEKCPEYDPNNWNEYPAVTPPEGVLMRIEASYEGDIYRQCAIFKNGIWKHEENGDAAWCLLGKVKRFRPWSED